jgi:hypothetical protein
MGRLSSQVELKEESHAARWGLMRGYSGKATKWVDFVRASSTQRKREEQGSKETLRKSGRGVKGRGGNSAWRSESVKTVLKTG